MSALRLRFLTVLCLPCVMLSKPEEGGVVWRDLGGSITIHCRPAVDGDASPNQDLLSLKRGLNRNEVFSTAHNLKDSITSKELKGRLEAVGTFPSVDLVLVNLTVEDTGPYWCEFTMLSDTMDTEEGKGAVLLVVKGGDQCTAENTHLFMWALVGCAALLLIIIIGFSLWIIPKTITRKAKRTITNDVYEDMRGTLRR